MLKTFEIGRLPIKSWASEVEEDALKQAENLSNLEQAFSHIALMADVHVGFGMPIGGVLATKNYIIPNAVGVDIGCGVIAARTDVLVCDAKEDKIRNVVNEVHKTIPLGFKKHREPIYWKKFNSPPKSTIILNEIENASYQLGTLGGGNHFMSMESGSDGYIWIMVHSGSRNFGYMVANHYNNIAKSQQDNLELKDLAGFSLDSELGRQYLEDMNYCLDFAKENRRRLLNSFYTIFSKHFDTDKLDDIIECHHNYAALENHYGEEVVVHRKGAINAELGKLGIIPGSMGTSSYIVEGLGNEESFKSSSHGAGRIMSRNEANKNIDRASHREVMKGIVYIESKNLDESPMAYKDIEEVMDNQVDLVKKKVKLFPMGVVKG